MVGTNTTNDPKRGSNASNAAEADLSAEVCFPAGVTIEPIEVPFEALIALKNGTLWARQGTHSAYEFKLTLDDVQPGQTKEKLIALAAEMNEQFPSKPNYPSCGFRVDLTDHYGIRHSELRTHLKDEGLNDGDLSIEQLRRLYGRFRAPPQGDLPNFQEADSVEFTCSSLLLDSTNRHRYEKFNHNGEERVSHEAFLSNLGLVEVPNDVVRVIAAMFRLARGFPVNETEMGTALDPGDMFEGKRVRTKQGTYEGSVGSYREGIRRGDEFDIALGHIGSVGGRPAVSSRGLRPIEVSAGTDRSERASLSVPGVATDTGHSFKQVHAPDGTAAIELKISGANGELVTCLLSKGAIGKRYDDLADYGRNELKGAVLLSIREVRAVVERLYDAIRGLRYDGYGLQTRDKDLLLAWSILSYGVRRDEVIIGGGLSTTQFRTGGDECVVDGWSVCSDSHVHWVLDLDWDYPAAFRVPSGEDKE